MASRQENIFIVILWLQVFAVTCLVIAMIVETDWRVLTTKNTTKYYSHTVKVGVWEICLPPTIEGADGYSLRCCHKFSLFEKFFPVEMKLGQILMPTAFCLAALGLICFSLAHEWRSHLPTQARWIFIAAGTCYIISSICILVPVSWNFHSVTRNKIIPFPPSLDLPPIVGQRNGFLVLRGFISGIILFITGIYIIGSGFITPNSIFDVLPV